MHELSLLGGVIDVVKQEAHGRIVSAVGLNVGTLSGVVVEALRAAWPIARSGSDLTSNAQLELAIIQATVMCPTCRREVAIDEFFALTCPLCGTPTADLRHGREFEITFIDVSPGSTRSAAPSTQPQPGQQPRPAHPGRERSCRSGA